MRLWRTLRLRARSLFARPGVDRDLDAELRDHLERQIEANLAGGMTPSDARQAALREFGNVVHIEEQCRDARGFRLIEDAVRDLRFGLRSSLRTPAFMIVAVLSLALGIGANTAIFSLINALMLRSLPVTDPGALVELGRITQYGRGGSFSYPIYERLRDEQATLTALLVQSNTTVQTDQAGEDSEDPPIGRFVSGNYFQTLGLAPAAGRLLGPDDDRLEQGTAAPAVISHAYWRRAFGARPEAVGASLTLNRIPFTIVGVMPRGFAGLETGRPVDFLLPIGAEPRLRAQSWLRGGDFNWLSIVGRLKPGVSVEAAHADLGQTFTRTMEGIAATARDPDNQRLLRTHRLTLAPAHAGLSSLRRQFESPVRLLMGAVALVLVIASANVVNLLLARAMARRREIALRLAIGAGRGRLIRQLLTEAAWLGLAGGALGLAFASWGTQTLLTLVANGDPRFALDAGPDVRVLLFTMTISIGASVLAALLPALRTSRVSIADAHEDARTLHAGPGHARWSQALVVVQVALSVVILAGAALALVSVRNLRTMDAGFDRDQVMLIGLSPGRAGYTGERRLQYYRDVLDRVRALPGIEGASVALITPISGGGVDLSLVVDGRSAEPDNMVYVNDVSDGYFRTMGTALRLGRDFSTDDRESSPAVAVINEALARRYFPSETPVGRRVRLGRDSLLEIVGVVENAKYLSLREPDRPTIYVNALQKITTGGLTLTVRSAPGTGDPAAVRRQVQTVASTVPIGRPSILSADIDRSLVNERLMANLLGAFAVLALVLACAGLYGVLGYTVARRTNEIGLRLALGATRGEVLRSVLGQSARIVTIGIIAGIAVALVATRLLSDLLYGVTTTDGQVLLAVVLFVAAVAALSALRPAWRASRVDPWVALRHD